MNVIVERERGLLELEERIVELKSLAAKQTIDLSSEIKTLEQKYSEIQQEIFGSMSAWQRVNMARHPKRPQASDYLAALAAFDELHGDRHFRDDPSIIAGFARLGDRRILAIGQEKGRDTKEKIRRNFGMVSPEGYRKVRRLIELASRLGLPIVSFVDTSGADPGIASEERGQSEAIAMCLYTLCGAPVPVVSTIIGEGGSGGALALALADHVIMPQHSIYSVASPEGCAAILWGDSAKAEEAAAHLMLTADDLLRFEIIDEIVAEPLGGAHRDPGGFVVTVLEAVARNLDALSNRTVDELLDGRYMKYRRIGAWQPQESRTV